MDLSGKSALVTGGAVRVGRALALALARAGCKVGIHYHRSGPEAEQARAAAAACGVQAVSLAADLADPAAAAGLVETAAAELGPLQVLVNSAAVFPEGDLASTTLASWEVQFAVNLRAPFLLSQAFAAQVPEPPPGGAAPGQILNVLDARVFRPGTDHLAYRLTKAALLAMTEGLARDLAPRLRVNAVALGAILPPPGEGAAYLDRLARERVPLRRAGDLDGVAASALHLLSDDFLTGVVTRVDGGEYL